MLTVSGFSVNSNTKCFKKIKIIVKKSSISMGIGIQSWYELTFCQ